MRKNYNNMISCNESNAISVIRSISMIMIVICHYCQIIPQIAFLGQFFNVGVQIFFIISGFLYGHKKIVEINQWYIKSLIKIVLPLYCYYFFIGIILIACNKLGDMYFKDIIKIILNLQGFTDAKIGNIITVHLWFISYILLCYLITPLLQILREKLSYKSAKRVIMLLSVIEIIFIMNINIHAFITQILGIIIYMSAYFLGAYWNKTVNHKQYILLTLSMIVAVCIRLYAKQIADSGVEIMVNSYDRVIAIYSHAILAYWFFFTIYILCNRFETFVNRLMPIIKFCDKRSFYIYIVHYMFLQGVFNVFLLTDNIIIGTLIFLTFTFIFASLLLYVYNQIFVVIYRNKIKGL